MKTYPLVILGAGRNSVDIVDILEAINDSPGRPKYDCIGFLDDNESLCGTTVCGTRVLGPLTSAGDYSDAWFINGIVNPANFWKKDQIIAQAKVPLERFATLVHPSVSVSRTAQLGRGTLVFPNGTICSHATVGVHVLVRPNSLLSHDSFIGDYSTITGGVCISGETHVGRLCYLGTGCTLRERITVGDQSLIGMGSVVIHDVEANSVVFGNPARFQRHTRPGEGEPSEEAPVISSGNPRRLAPPAEGREQCTTDQGQEQSARERNR